MNAPSHGIPTEYRGVRFRSRTEATWAAFFDLVNWQWDFEPFDLDGYIPDFVVRFRPPLLVEVKPAVFIEELRERTRKIERSGWEHEALILLSAPLADDHPAHPVLGLIGERHEAEWSWETALAFTCRDCGNLSVLAESGSWRCRVCGANDGNAHVWHVAGGLTEWAQAKNRTQWRPGP